MMYLGKDPIGMVTSLPVFNQIAQIEVGNYKSLTDENASETTIAHSLGDYPDFVFYYCDSMEMSESYTDIYLIFGLYCSPNLSSYAYPMLRYCVKTNPSKTTVGASLGTGPISNYASTESFHFPYKDNTDKLKANTIYHYIIGKFKEVTSNANE